MPMLLEKVGIDRGNGRPIKSSSCPGGEQQRSVSRGHWRAIQLSSLLDEPTGNLDKDTESDILDIFKSLAHSENRCVIIVTFKKSNRYCRCGVWHTGWAAFRDKTKRRVEKWSSLQSYLHAGWIFGWQNEGSRSWTDNRTANPHHTTVYAPWITLCGYAQPQKKKNTAIIALLFCCFGSRYCDYGNPTIPAIG